MTIVVAPSALSEVIWVTPGICANCRSSGAATDEAMVSALAPWQVGGDLDGRKVDLRQRSDRQERKGDDADEGQRRHQQRGGDRPADERFGEVHELLPAAAAGWRRADRDRGVALELVLTVGHDALAVAEARGDDGQIAGRRADLDRTRLRRCCSAVTIQTNRPFGPRWTAADGNDDGVAAGVEQHVAH